MTVCARCRKQVRRTSRTLCGRCSWLPSGGNASRPRRRTRRVTRAVTGWFSRDTGTAKEAEALAKLFEKMGDEELAEFRRHVTNGQWAIVATKVRKLCEAEASARQREAA